MSSHLPRHVEEGTARTITVVVVASVVACLVAKEGAGVLSIGGVC